MMQETISKELGRRVRRIRQERGLTLKQIEERVGVSATHISEIERGNTSPTIGALEKIADALGVLPSYLIDIPPQPELRVQKREERRPLSMAGGSVVLDPLTDRSARSDLSLFVATIRTTGQVEAVPGHQGEEFCYVLEGILEVTVNGTSHVLRSGDSFHFKAVHPHRIRNLAPTPSRTVWAVRPRLFI
ncbi:MAG: helix-turn-helix domain-containing protein [Candidatus Eisenbacteria bacterium]|nr:XRE family transcriptional regulator [Candidatus Eisenbacteria bacterium]